MEPAVYGPHFWGTMHISALYGSHPEAFKALVESYVYNLPCKKCRRHFAKLLVEFPVDSVPDPFVWSVEAHNAVNRQLGKPIISVEEARDIWTNPSMPLPWATISLVLFLVLVFYIVTK